MRPSRRQSGTLLLALLFSSLPASALTVTTIADELDTPAGPEISLREAMRDTSSGGTVDFAASLSGQAIELTMGAITTFYTTLTIDASSLPLGITISGGGSSRIFEPETATLNLVNLTLTKGSATSGGAIYNRTSSTVTMTRCRLFDNEATQEGGAIYCLVSDLILNDCWLGYNRAGTRGGAIYLLGVQCDLSLVNSTLTHNTAYLDGGGISAHTINSVSLQGSTLSHNAGAGPDIGAYEAGNRAGYPVWAAEEIPTGWDATFDGNSEGDAWQNGIEYACRRNPRVDDGASVLHIELMPSGDGGSEVHLSFPYEPDAPDLFYFIRRNGDLVSPLGSRYRYNSATGGQLYHPSGNVTSALDPAGKTITVIDAGIGVGPHFWRLEVEEIP